MSDNPKRIGVFVCSGCGIGSSIDVEGLGAMASGEQNIACCQNHRALCSVQGLNLITDAIERESLNGLVIAACSPRVKQEVFAFADGLMTERVNLREQVAWCFEPGVEDTRMAAEDAIRMGMAKVNSITVPKPYIPVSISRDVLVLGGGISGMTAALEGAKAGYQIHLIEKEPQFGGRWRELYMQYPINEPYTNLENPEYGSLIEAIEAHPNITVHLNTTIQSISGEPGAFQVLLTSNFPLPTSNSPLPTSNPPLPTFLVGSIVVATGWKPYDATKLGQLGYGKDPRVITNQEFEQLMLEDPNRKLPDKVLFIQCAGSRDPDHLPYCSNYCCNTSLKQVQYVRRSNPNSVVYVIYKDIRSPGMGEDFYREVQQDEQVLFTKGRVTEVQGGEGESPLEEIVTEVTNGEEVSANARGRKKANEQKIDWDLNLQGSLLVTVEETLLGEPVSLEVDLVVLATGMVPNGTDGLNLEYRLGKGLPELKYDFSDSHFICFPYETRRTGIYAAGCVRAPMDLAACREDAAGAMFKAIQCIEATSRGEAVHPRAGDKSYPELYMDRCTDCKRCTEECPFGAYDETEKGTPLPNPSRCRRCGICLGSCPERVIGFADFSINSISAMIKSVHIPDEFEEKPRILAFVCENDAYPALDMAGIERQQYSAYVRVIPVRCLGSVNKVWISDALSCGFDGILQIGCKPGDDYQCHFIHGSELTETRGENIQETLTSMMLEPERIKTEFVEITDYKRITEIINDYVAEIELIGPNPFKGM